MWFGYAGRMLSVDLSSGVLTVEPLSRRLCEQYIGGRGRDAKTIFDKMTDGIDSFDERNILCISAGAVTGLLGPTAGRVNVATAVSPLSGMYCNSNAGAHWGAELKFAGFDGITIKGVAPDLCYLFIEDGRAELRDASHLAGKGVFDTTLILKEELGEDVMVAAAGPGAEGGALFGSVVFDYWDVAGRGGLGSVMAQKKLKAVAVRGTGKLAVADPTRYIEVVREGWQAILNEPGFILQEHPGLGTAICVNWGNAQGWLPTRNFQTSHFEDADKISGEFFRDNFSTRRSPLPGGRACLSCPNRCKRFGRIETGKYAGTRGNIEFEGIAAFGSKCGVSDMAAVFHAFMLANDYGLDCIECGNTIALLMDCNERGLLPSSVKDELDIRFGDADAMVEAVHRIGTLDGEFGRLGALGAHRVAQKLGKEAETTDTSVKGLSTIACDPRVAKAFGFTYAVSSRGSDHLRTHPVYEMLNMPKEVSKELFGSEEASKLTAYGGKVNMVLWHEEMAAVTDSMGTCRFMHASYYAQYPIPELLHKYGKKKGEPHSIKYHEWLSAATGMNFDYERLLEVGRRIIMVERAINLRCGLSVEDDTLPERFFKEPIPDGPQKGAVFDYEKFKEMLADYYNKRGWDLRTGKIYKSTLIELGMEDVLNRLARLGLVVEG